MLKEIIMHDCHYFLDKNDLIQGEYKEYWHNDILFEHSFYLNGNRHGECKIYHDNGQLWVHHFYKNGKRHGEYYVYGRNGKLKVSTFFYYNTDLNVNPSTLTEKDKTYILLSGRLPPRD